MVVLGLLLIAFGVVAILAALFSTSGTASFLGADIGARTIFLIGAAAGVAILWGFTISKLGARRGLRHRRESRRLQELSNKLDRAEGRHQDEREESGS
jgi:hypothetical protein